MWQEPLQILPVERWEDLRSVFLSDWPRGMPGYNVLATQTRWKKQGLDYGFQVYCPFGDARNGFVAVNEKASSYEIIIQYPKDDTETLEEALKTTKIINWNKKITLPFTSFHVIECIEKIIQEKNITLKLLASETFILEKDSPLFNINIPPELSFKLLTPEYIELIDLKWPHRYPTSTWYFQLLIDTKAGYGLFKGKELVSWVFIGESGNLTHLYTMEQHRKKGYADLILKLISNELLKEKKEVFAFCVKGNTNACKLYHKVGFQKLPIEVTWGWLSD